MTEQILALMIAAGFLLSLVAQVWLIVKAFGTSVWWGLATLLLPPVALVFIVRHWRKAQWPVVLFVVAALLVGVPYGINAVQQRMAGFGPHEQLVDGERHVTLTGWKGGDYASIAQRPDVVVLQMANADVTDATIEHLRGLTRLKELDLNDTQITDAALPILAELPALAVLRLKATKITDAGFQEHLLPKEGLRDLDVRETEVASKTLREWKNAQEGRRYLK